MKVIDPVSGRQSRAVFEEVRFVDYSSVDVEEGDHHPSAGRLRRKVRFVATAGKLAKSLACDQSVLDRVIHCCFRSHLFGRAEVFDISIF